MVLRSHEIQALEFLSLGPDRIRVIEDDGTLAAAMVFIELNKRGLVEIDPEDGMLVTINAAGRRALDRGEG